jgi:glycosylphosphatidylinositol transamidase (GPIT) subunit GPI8
VLLPVLENMSEDQSVKVNHYWLLVLNIKDRRFEVLDSMRTINDKKLGLLVKNLQEAITSLWNEEYPKSRIKLEKFDLSDIFVPKQKTK